MQTLQLVGITPDALADLIDTRLNKRFKEVTEHLQPKKPNQYLTRQQVAELLSVDLSTVHNLSKRKVLQKLQIGGRVLYLRSDVENSIININK